LGGNETLTHSGRGAGTVPSAFVTLTNQGAGWAAVAQGTGRHRDEVPGLQRVVLDPRAHQRARSFGLEAPQRLLTLVIGDHDIEPSMRVHVREFLHGPADRDGLLGLVHRRGVVSKRRHRSHQNEGYANSRTQLTHRTIAKCPRLERGLELEPSPDLGTTE
jgi:hypothetical protein